LRQQRQTPGQGQRYPPKSQPIVEHAADAGGRRWFFVQEISLTNSAYTAI
jgi:hypothetical protein